MEPNEDTKQHINNGKGGWLSSFLVLGTSMGLGIASGAWVCNLIVFLISIFNVKNIAAAQISNIISGFVSLFPFVTAVLADSAFGAFSVTLVSSIVSLLGVFMFTLIVTIKSLRPPPCPLHSTCVPPTTFQNSFLYITLILASLGLGGSRFLLGTMGADQLDNPKHQARFFNWFVFVIYFSWIIGYTLLIYIQTSVSWALSFFIALAANMIAVALFLPGSRIYRKIPPQGSPFTSIARVFVAAFKNKKMVDDDCYLHENQHSKLSSYEKPSKNLGFLNRAALIKQGDNETRDTIKKSWSQCTVEEVEDLKKLIKIMPLWSSSIFLSVAVGIIMSFTVLMALVMDRSVTSYYKIPPATFVVVTFVLTAITSSMLDRYILPTYKKLTGRHLSFLTCIGVGHACNILAVISFALIERRRHKLIEAYHLTDQQNAVAPLSALWLIIPLVITGIGEGFSFSPEVALYYQEFPKSLRSTSTSMISLHIAAGFYISSAFINLVGRTTSWLPNDINHGRVDKACWVLAIVITVNFAYFLVCARLYKYNNPDSTSDNSKTMSN
ncbi:protein NRT1/ PTR FAMILY 2.7-like [Chenopodium quinoa]|uniref:protein NRT1/ PTR FAMILY 2.7-like n=1 Tax=Chenopodium quinoa TaxID=63459 RepID=UPI000B775413|nr:protein NRT1/ PTR FAMILY 2.7-like [Chenopodium quinoa]